MYSSKAMQDAFLEHMDECHDQECHLRQIVHKKMMEHEAKHPNWLELLKDSNPEYFIGWNQTQ